MYGTTRVKYLARGAKVSINRLCYLLARKQKNGQRSRKASLHAATAALHFSRFRLACEDAPLVKRSASRPVKLFAPRARLVLHFTARLRRLKAAAVCGEPILGNAGLSLDKSGRKFSVHRKDGIFDYCSSKRGRVAPIYQRARCKKSRHPQTGKKKPHRRFMP